jgi:hypothetical protein
MPGILQRALHSSANLILTTNEKSLKKLKDLPKVTQLLNLRSRMQTKPRLLSPTSETRTSRILSRKWREGSGCMA